MAETAAQGRRFGRAVVIGGSIAGLMTARALADTFAEVILLERDPEPEGPDARKGVPQGRHVHVLLTSGRRVMDDFFPGIVAELREGGASLLDTTADVSWYHFGVWRTRVTSGIHFLTCTRPYLEEHVRRRLRALGNVELRCGVSALGPLASADRSRITGVTIASGSDGGAPEELLADLVVDASGRGSRTPRWLTDLGYDAPPEEKVGIDLTYTSRIFQPPPGAAHPWKFLIVYPRSPENWRSGFIQPVEGGRWLVSLNGYFGEHAPHDDAGFLAYAGTLPRPEIAEALAGAEPLTPITSFKIPASTRRHYDKLRRFPEGLVVIGDAVTAFNPTFGQGMSVASLSAELLRTCAYAATDLRALTAKFRAELPKVVELPWLLGTSMDLHYPQSVGERPLALPALNWYVGRLLEMTSRNPRVCRLFFEVLNLNKGLGTLLMPNVSLPVLLFGLQGLFTPLAERADVGAPPLAGAAG